MYGIRENDPSMQLLDISKLSEDEVAQISELMLEMGRLRDAERKVSEASARYMKLNDTDMRALHYLIVCENQGVTATATDIADYLGISGSSTTKLLDRLEKANHVIRTPHPTDRRALQITITPETRRAAYETVGKHQSRRFYSAARLTSQEREIVIRFLRDMANDIDVSHADWIDDE